MAVFAGAVCRCSLGVTSYGSPPSRARLRHIGPPSHCRDRPFQQSPHVTAPLGRSGLRTEHAAWAAAATPVAPVASLQCLKCGRLCSLHTLSTRSRSGLRFAFAMSSGFRFVVRFPMLRQTQQLSGRHLDQCKHLAALRDQCVVFWTRDAECAPEPRALYAIQPALNHQPVAELGCASIIDLSADYDRIRLLLHHLHERETELLRKMCARDLNKTQVRNIGDNASAIGIEKHYLDVCANTGGHGRFHIFDLN